MKLWRMHIAVVLLFYISPFQSYGSQKPQPLSHPGKPFRVTKQDVTKAQNPHGRDEDEQEPGSPMLRQRGEEADPLIDNDDSSDDEDLESGRSCCCPTWHCWKGLALSSCYGRDRR